MAESPVDEAVLLARARTRDRDAFVQLVSRYEQPLLAVLTPIAGDRERARDLVQDTILRAFEHLDRYVEEHRFSTWFFRIGVNLAISTRRRLRLEQRVRDAAEGDPGTGIDKSPSSLEGLARREEAQALARAVGRLPPRYLEIVRMRYQDGLSCQEIARRLSSTANTVSLILFRAKQRLREELSSA